MRRLIAAATGALLLLVLVPVARAAPAGTGEKWALIVVVNNYKAPTNPAGGPRDAPDVREALVRNGWPEGNIRTLVDGAATAANVRAGMDWLAERSNDASFSVVHFSGHVKQLQGPEADGATELLWLYDNVLMADDEFGKKMQALRGDAWINVSGCEGGGFDEGISGPRRLFTASSLETEKSYADADGNSFFTGLLVREGLLHGAGEADGNGAVSIQEAFDHAARVAPQRTANFKDGPQHPYLAGGDGSQWFLSPPPPAAKASPLPEELRRLPVVKDLPVDQLPLPELPKTPLPKLPVSSSLLPK